MFYIAQVGFWWVVGEADAREDSVERVAGAAQRVMNYMRHI